MHQWRSADAEACNGLGIPRNTKVSSIAIAMLCRGQITVHGIRFKVCQLESNGRIGGRCHGDIRAGKFGSLIIKVGKS